MKWLINSAKIRLVLVVFAVGLVVGGGSAKGDFTFGEPINLGPTINSASWEERPYISADGLLLYFNSGRPGGHGGSDLWMSTRLTVEDDWQNCDERYERSLVCKFELF